MKVRPEIQALQRDDSAQREAQDALSRTVDGWRSLPEVAQALAEMNDFAIHGSNADCPALASLFEAGNPAGERLVEELVRGVCRALELSPLGHVTLRHFTDGTVSTLQLARSGNATLTLVALDGPGLAARPEPVTADFPQAEVWERFLAGAARAERIERRFTGEDTALLNRRWIDLAPGSIMTRDASREMLMVRSVVGSLVSLRLMRRRPDAGPTPEYRLSDGKLVRQAAGNPQDSRMELMMAVLGRMQRKDAAPELAAIATGQGSSALRWQALRECLSLDTYEGFCALTEIARSVTDDLARAAGALRSQLIEAHPQLAEVDACRAS